jgi:hypothetical protein
MSRSSSRIWQIAALVISLGTGCSGEELPIDAPIDTGEVVEEEPELLSFEVTGTVVDDDGAGLPEAMVLVGGREDTLVFTDEDGLFSLWYTEIKYGQPAVVAAKEGFRAIGFDYFEPDTPITLTLREVKGSDNVAYTYQDPGNGLDLMKEDCSHCHGSFVSEFMGSKHAEATKNPLLQDLYAGVTRAYSDEDSCTLAGGVWADGLEPGTVSDSLSKCYLGGGVLPDLNLNCGGDQEASCDDIGLAADELPEDFGACADCHAPGIDGVAGGRDLHDALGLAYESGVHCDTCHKVKDIDISLPPGVGNRLIMGRPNEPGRNTFEWDPVYYGPLIDVPNIVMGGSYQPKFELSLLCSGCHEQNQDALIPGEELDTARWPAGLPTHSTYSEWQTGPYNQDATQCQFCHMPADMELNNAVDISRPENQSITFGFSREPEDIRQHLFRGPLQGNPRLIDQALYVSVKTESDGDELIATVSLSNNGCGHAVPTGEPMRSLIMLVEASGSCGDLEPSGGMTVHDVGGAMAQGVLGITVLPSGGGVDWPVGAALAQVGDSVRVVRPTGVYDDYNGVGAFGGTQMSPEAKGLEIDRPVGEALIESINGSQIILDKAFFMEDGDIFYLGDSLLSALVDGQEALHLAGRAGYTFSKVLVDSDGNRQVPHYKAIDMASDNRISPGTNSLTTHRFEIPSGCSSGEVRASVLYRPIPLNLARLRGWDSKDYLIAEGVGTW